MKKNKRDKGYLYEDYPYECCVKSGGDNITRGGYGAMRSPTYEDNASIVWDVIKRILAVLCGIIGVAFALSFFAGLWLIGDAIHVSNWGGEIHILTHQISVEAASWLGTIGIFGGGLLAGLFFYICDEMW